MICKCLRNQGVTVYPHDSKSILTIGQITVTLVNLCIALLHSNVTVVYIVAYGFKADIQGFYYLDPLRLAIGHEIRMDLGRNVKSSTIPLFNCQKGKTYPMFFGLGGNNGSVYMDLCGGLTNVTSVHLKVYPHIMHVLKAMHLNEEIPKSIVGIRKKLYRFENIIIKLNRMQEDLTGYRFEFCFVGKMNIRDAHELVTSYGLEDNIPRGVTCTEFTANQYIQNVIRVLNEVKKEGLGYGKCGKTASSVQQSLFARLLNAGVHWRKKGEPYWTI